MKAIEVFSKNWSNLPEEQTKIYSYKENFELKNNTTADIAILKGNDCVAFGNFFEKLQLPTKDEIRYYFHRANGFIGCGTSSLFWFYFDETEIIINDLKYKYPYDELMKDYYEFLERLTEQKY